MTQATVAPAAGAGVLDDAVCCVGDLHRGRCPGRTGDGTMVTTPCSAATGDWPPSGPPPRDPLEVSEHAEVERSSEM